MRAAIVEASNDIKLADVVKVTNDIDQLAEALQGLESKLSCEVTKL